MPTGGRRSGAPLQAPIECTQSGSGTHECRRHASPGSPCGTVHWVQQKSAGTRDMEAPPPRPHECLMCGTEVWVSDPHLTSGCAAPGPARGRGAGAPRSAGVWPNDKYLWPNDGYLSPNDRYLRPNDRYLWTKDRYLWPNNRYLW